MAAGYSQVYGHGTFVIYDICRYARAVDYVLRDEYNESVCNLCNGGSHYCCWFSDNKVP